jgi:hypothetical protein
MFEKCKTWFLHSEIILWARLQVLVGAIWTVLSTADLSPVLDPKWMTYWLIINGVISELLRRRGTETRDGVLRSVDTVDKK